MRKTQNRKVTRDTGSRINYFGDEPVSSPSDIQKTIDTIALAGKVSYPFRYNMLI